MGQLSKKTNGGGDLQAGSFEETVLETTPVRIRGKQDASEGEVQL